MGLRSRGPALGTAPAVEVLEAGLAPLVPRRLDGLVAVAVDEAGAHEWSTGSWSTLPGTAGGAPVFQIGSVTKVFTALLLARAVDDGRVTLDDPVDPLRVGGRPVTLRDLVTHRSGLPRVPRGARRGADLSDPYRPWDERRLRDATAAAGDRVRPGREAPIAYSNFGFAVLGLALADALGTGWEQALREQVLVPAGMTATAVHPTAPRAVSPSATQPWELSAFAPAGGLWTSAADLRVWLELLVEASTAAERDPLLAAVRTAVAPHATSRYQRMGMAWHLFDDDTVAWHNGGVLGACSFVGVDLRRHRAVGVLAVGGPTARLDRAAMRVLTGARRSAGG